MPLLFARDKRGTFYLLIVTIFFVLFLTGMLNSGVFHVGYREIMLNSTKNKLSKKCLVPSEQSTSSWLKMNPKEMSAQDLMDYFSWSNSSSCKLAHDFGGKMMADPSGLDGQKAVCIQPASVAPPPGSCLVYSFGINDEWSFDDAMANYGCDIYAFDPSMKDAKYQFDRSPRIHFFKIGLGALDKMNDALRWKIRTLGSIRRHLKHQNRLIDYLKLDIEGEEWTVLNELMKSGELAQVRQMGVEIHLPSDEPLEKYQELAGILWSLERKHGMNRFDSKANLWFKGNFSKLDIRSGFYGYEIAWFNTKLLS